MSYHLRQMWLAMRGNLTATLATLTTMILTLFLLGSVSLVTLNLDNNLSKLESDVEIGVFLDFQADMTSLSRIIESYPEVESVKKVNKLQIFEEMSRDYPYIAETNGLVENPFPNTLRVKLKDPAYTSLIAERLKHLSGVGSVEYGEGFINQAMLVIDTIRKAAYILVVLLLLNTVFNILNTVRVAMYARRNEINIMRLLGARRSFIRMPYVLEGLLLGVLAGIFNTIVLYPGYLAVSNTVQKFLPALPIVRDTAPIQFILLMVAVLAILIGGLGSLFAANRYLQEIE